MKYPIGIQTFEEIRNNGYVYVDKTDLIYELTQNYKYVFLGRPRRFGKSLLLSTLEAYFEGRKDLFSGLAIENLEADWVRHPVIHIDLNIGNYSTVQGLLTQISDQLRNYENLYGCNPDSSEPQHRLRWIIQQAHEQTGQKVVILVDEYDKPVLQAMGDSELDLAFRDILKPFYGNLKSEDSHIEFAMLTGVSKLGQLSVFSDLNHLEDVSLNKEYATICGITEEEMLTTFDKEIDEFARAREVSKKQMVDDLRMKYDGYRFTSVRKLVYNPFSLLSSIKNRGLNDYWFETGTPTFLVKLLQKNDYDLSKIEGEKMDEGSLYKMDNNSALPLLYQSGYLTIKEFNDKRGICTLGYPNQEVESAFLNFLVPFYSNVPDAKSKAEIYDFVDEVEAADVDAFMTRLQSIFAAIPYAKDKSMKVQEDQFRNLMYLVFKLLSFQIQVECQMSKGRSDAVVWTKDHIYVMEFKINKTPEEALAQIHEKGYAQPYASDTRPVTLIGINYSTAERAITGWLTQEQGG